MRAGFSLLEKEVINKERECYNEPCGIGLELGALV